MLFTRIACRADRKGDYGDYGAGVAIRRHAHGGNRYPPKMIPGVDIVLHTTATNDRAARLLLSATGLPFYGKHRN